MSKISFPGGGAGAGYNPIETFPVDTPAFAWFGFHPSGQSGVAWRASPPAEGDSVVVAVSRDEWSTSGTMTDATAGVGNNRTAQGHTLLDADTLYKYEVLNNGDKVTEGQFTTAAKSGVVTNFSVVFGSCQSGYIYDNIIFNSASGQDPQLFLHLGDLGYLDVANTTAQAAMARQLFTPESTWVSGITRRMLWAGVWDDHDFGGNNQDGDHNGKHALASGWDNFYPHNELPDTSGALYRKFTYGDVEFFMLDQRFWRDPNEADLGNGSGVGLLFPTNFPDVASGATSMTIQIDPSGGPSAIDDFYKGYYVDVSGVKDRILSYDAAPTATLTLTRGITDLYAGAAYTLSQKSLHDGGDNTKGQDQVAWLASGLLESACTWKVIVSSTTWNPSTAFASRDAFSQHDENDNEWGYLVQMLSGVVDNVILVEGDTHFGAIDDGTTSPFPTIMAGPLQEDAGSTQGTWSEGDTASSGIQSYGKIDFTGANVTLSVIQESGHLAISKVINNVLMMDPDDASVSGELDLWITPGGLDPFVPGQSGFEHWHDGSSWEDNMIVGGTASGSIASGVQNGLNAAYFINDDSDRYSSVNDYSVGEFVGTDLPITVIGVMRPDGGQGGGEWSTLYSLGDVAQGFEGLQAFGVDQQGQIGYLKIQDGGAGAITMRVSDYTPGEWIVVSWVDSGTETRIYKNGVEVTVAASGSDVGGAITPDKHGIGVMLTENFLGDTMDGMIGELAVYSSGMADAERTKIEQGLLNKWGIS